MFSVAPLKNHIVPYIGIGTLPCRQSLIAFRQKGWHIAVEGLYPACLLPDQQLSGIRNGILLLKQIRPFGIHILVCSRIRFLTGAEFHAFGYGCGCLFPTGHGCLILHILNFGPDRGLIGRRQSLVVHGSGFRSHSLRHQ